MKELEMILAAVAQLGEAGKEAFIWWLVMDKGLGFLGLVSVMGIIAAVILRGIKHFSCEEILKCLRDEMGVGSYGWLAPREVKEMFNWVREHKDK